MFLSLSVAGLGLSGLAYASPNATTTLTGSLTTSSGVLEIPKGASCACAKISQAMPQSLILPGSQNYTTQAIDSYWDIRADLSPACIVVPFTVFEVSEAVRIIGTCQAKFAVRGGGHMNVSLRSMMTQKGYKS
jgi:hypothetical protein